MQRNKFWVKPDEVIVERREQTQKLTIKTKTPKQEEKGVFDLMLKPQTIYTRYQNRKKQ